jgi:hypothetical protein
MRLLALALVLAAGCSPDDLCIGPEVASLTCVTVKVAGSTDAPFDRLQVDSTYSDGTATVTHRSVVVNTADGGVATNPPVEFPIVFTNPNVDPSSYSTRLVVLAYAGSVPVGLGTAGPGDYPSNFSSIKRGDHGHATVTLQTITKDPNNCFHPTRCGGSSGYCPACTLGQPCDGYTGNCADSHCGYDSTGSNEICLPGLN